MRFLPILGERHFVPSSDLIGLFIATQAQNKNAARLDGEPKYFWRNMQLIFLHEDFIIRFIYAKSFLLLQIKQNNMNKT